MSTQQELTQRFNSQRPALLGRTSQIYIIEMHSKGKSFEEMDEILEVKPGSSKLTYLKITGGK